MVTSAMLPLLRAGQGRVVNVSAPTARVPGPFYGPISASKAAVQALSDVQRLELERWGIRVVIVEPGTLETQIFAKAAAAAQKSMAAQPAERVALYQQQIDTVGAALAKIKPSSPSIAANAIVTALTARKPKPRYTVGPDVRLIGIVSRLPLNTRDRMMRSVTGLAKLKQAG
jgi:NAD(P)-dependent dehydrogenase (short-subunit alcohol dehydrogenase family)